MPELSRDFEIALHIGQFTIVMVPRGFAKTTIAGIAIPIRQICSTTGEANSPKIRRGRSNSTWNCVMSAGPVGFQYAAEVSYPAPESTSQGMLLWVGQITGMVFVAGMSTQSNRFLPAFMIAFAVLSLILFAAVLLLRESPMIITEKDRNPAS